MNIEQAFENILDSLKRILLFINLGKYNHVMQGEDIEQIKSSIEQIISNEDDFKNAKKTMMKNLKFIKEVEKYKNFSIRDFIEYKTERL